MPERLGRLSPFWHTPLLPIEDFTVTPLVVLTAVAAALMVTGIAGFHRRDLA